MSKNRIIIFVAALALMAGSAEAQYCCHHRPHHHRIPRTTTVIRTVPPKHAELVNRLTRKDRFDMAVAFLKANPCLSVKQYAKMTGLKKSVAEAELNVFASDVFNPIRHVAGKKNLYCLKG